MNTNNILNIVTKIKAINNQERLAVLGKCDYPFQNISKKILPLKCCPGPNRTQTLLLLPILGILF